MEPSTVTMNKATAVRIIVNSGAMSEADANKLPPVAYEFMCKQILSHESEKAELVKALAEASARKGTGTLGRFNVYQAEIKNAAKEGRAIDYNAPATVSIMQSGNRPTSCYLNDMLVICERVGDILGYIHTNAADLALMTQSGKDNYKTTQQEIQARVDSIRKSYGIK